MIERDSTPSAFGAASVCLGDIRRRARRGPPDGPSLSGAQNRRKFGLNRRPSGGCRINMGGATMLNGSCLCRTVTYEVDQLDMPIAHCHLDVGSRKARVLRILTRKIAPFLFRVRHPTYGRTSRSGSHNSSRPDPRRRPGNGSDGAYLDVPRCSVAYRPRGRAQLSRVAARQMTFLTETHAPAAALRSRDESPLESARRG